MLSSVMRYEKARKRSAELRAQHLWVPKQSCERLHPRCLCSSQLDFASHQHSSAKPPKPQTLNFQEQGSCRMDRAQARQVHELQRASGTRSSEASRFLSRKQLRASVVLFRLLLCFALPRFRDARLPGPRAAIGPGGTRPIYRRFGFGCRREV